MTQPRQRGRMMMALRSGAGRAFGLWLVIGLVALLAMPPPMAVTAMLVTAVGLGLHGLWQTKKRGDARQKRVASELKRRGLKVQSITVQRFGGTIEFVATEPSGREVRGALRGEKFSIDERRWVN